METEEVFENQLGYEISVSEMKRRLDGVYSGIDEIKKTFRSIFSAASLIVALIGALQIFSVKVIPAYQVYYTALFITSMVLYVFLIIGCIWMLSPIKVKGPTPEDWDVLYEGFSSQKDDIEIYKQLLSNYINAINKSEVIAEKRYRWALFFLPILPIIVVLMLIIGLLPKIPVP